MRHFTLLTTRTCLIALLASLTLTGCPTGDDGPAPEDQTDMSGGTGGAEAPSENPDGRAPADGLDEAPAQGEVDVLDPEGISTDDLTRPGPGEMADPREDEEDSPTCAETCEAEALEVYEACMDRHDDEQGCRDRARRTQQRCVAEECTERVIIAE